MRDEVPGLPAIAIPSRLQLAPQARTWSPIG
jgi:hypothetical protein